MTLNESPDPSGLFPEREELESLLKRVGSPEERTWAYGPDFELSSPTYQLWDRRKTVGG